MVYITKSPSTFQNARFLRYQMQSVARHILTDNRVKICLRYQREKYGNVDVFRHKETSKAFYGGLMVCGSVWICPVCAGKISERRKMELKHAVSVHRSNGGYLSMITLTFSHTKGDRLERLLKSLSEATKIFRSGRKYNDLRNKIGLIGSVRAFEITYGNNGWHPHIHLLNFHTKEIEGYESSDIQSKYYELWSVALGKVGLTSTEEHGLKLDDATYAESYIGKWGDLVESHWQIDSEMTKSNIKKGREESLTPFDFLRKVVEDGDLTYMEQYKEYAKCMKGKTQLYWSKGLKEKFSIVNKSDEEIAESKDEPADMLGALEWHEWKYILENEKRVELLNLTEEIGFYDAIQKLGLKRKTTVAPVVKVD